jgi:carbon monoxide dehydrogenase subunit G
MPLQVRITCARTVSELFSMMRGASIVRAWAGIEARTRDELPIIGPSAHHEGLYHQFGFSAHGFQLGPGAGAVMAELIVNGGSQTRIAELAIDRFRRFIVASPPDKVFGMFGDIGQMAACLPGASLTGHPTPEHVEGVIRVKLGPISAGFRGAARIERDLNTMSGRIVGTGDDQRSRSSAQGEIRYRLVPIEQGIATRVELSIGYRLQGILAQIAREGLVRGLAARLTTEFASNVELQLSGNVVSGPTRQTKAIDGVALAFDQFRMLVREFLRRTWNR